MDTFDLKGLDKGLHTGPELTGIAVVVQTVDGKHGPAVFIVHNVADKGTFEAPVVTILHLLINNALCTVFLRQAV